MANSAGKRILLVVAVVAAAGIGYMTLNGGGGPTEGVEGAIGTADQHQSQKTQYYEGLNKSGEALSPDTIEILGTIAAKFEYAPAEAEKMLEERGWSKEVFDGMLEDIRSNDELNKVFQAAKKRASQL